MGYASYFEDVVERAIDDAMMGLVFASGARRHAPPQCVVTAATVPNSPLHVTSRSAEERAFRIAATVRELCEMHILCFSELRPKAQSRHYV
jgi:hypothetical protein